MPLVSISSDINSEVNHVQISILYAEPESDGFFPAVINCVWVSVTVDNALRKTCLQATYCSSVNVLTINLTAQAYITQQNINLHGQKHLCIFSNL